MKKLILSLLAIACICLSGRAQSTPGTFEIGKNTFLLNGKPTVLKAAEIHYPRIPEPYWEQRIQMCKSLGMNAVCIYIFWNLHEQKPGEFNFTGNNDIAKFCRLAQKHGMYVIVRPGPYVCAEWEMGGLPWWLLKKQDIKLRTLDPYYMERVGIFMKAVGKQLADLQITRGGNIIMVQVENEYGSYRTDKPYVSAVRDIVKEAGFTEVPLFQCDWSSNFLNNALDGLLWTVNFGTGANIDSQFRKLKEVAPDVPLMCSEFWSGWFDHWGRKHETREGAVMVEGIKDMLDRNISFSLYMTHGGTTFGHWGGANNPAYSAMCSSYDYDAPISEAGWTTEKFWSLRKLLQSYLQPGETLPEAPADYPVIEIPAIDFVQVAPLFSNLPTPKKSIDIQPMEQFDQGWGSILYRTTLPQAVKAGATLKITEVHDWAQVFADGKLLARLDRRRGEFTTLLPDLKAGTQLDILVEAMGRVNFGISIHDRKGITEKVEIIEKGEATNLKNWTVYNLPVDYSFARSKKYAATKTLPTMPAYYKATFKLDKVGDTFLDMSTWGKGMVWVNGHAMGRFWEIGPQQTLFMPGCWLKKGVNEIIVLDLKGPQQATVKGITKPILDDLREKAPETHRKKGQDLQLAAEKAVAQGTFNKGNGWQEVKFPAAGKTRYFCLEALSSWDGTNVAAIAEFDVLDANGKPVSREPWKIMYADSEETRSGNCTADKIFDLQESTFWSTVDNKAYPHQVVIDLGKEYDVAGFRYLPRAEKDAPGLIKDYKVYVRTSDFDYSSKPADKTKEVIAIIHKVNSYWQTAHPVHGRSFWDNAAYHTGNMEAYFLTKEPKYLAYSEAWAEHNEWKGAKSANKKEWKYSYGESDDFVLFGDYQICFQTYADLYNLAPDERKIARAREVMEYEMSTSKNDYWWWADGLYMVMPVMTKLYKITGNPLYLEKLHEYLRYADSIMYDAEAGLYYRDAKYVYPKHKSANGKKDFWARGDGWVLAGLAKVLKDLPETDKYRPEYVERFRTMAKAVAACQQPEGYWTRSMLDPEHAPGPETSGTAFFTYGILWGINNGLLDKAIYQPVIEKSWKYLTTVALQPDGKVGYVQPIGEKAIPGQVVDANSTANFGVGAFLLAACEMVRFRTK